MKHLLFLSAVCVASVATAQNTPEVLKPGQGAKLAVPAVAGEKPKAKKPKGPTGPTVITSRQAEFRNSTQTAEFKFEVTVDGPTFKISCDELKITMKPKSPAPAAGAVKPAEEPKDADGKAAIGGAMGGNIEEAIAIGNVIITQEKPGKDGEPTRILAKGKKAVYNSTKQSLIITGWPQVIQSSDGKPSRQTNALEEKTKVILFESNDMEIDGLNEVIFHPKEK